MTESQGPPTSGGAGEPQQPQPVQPAVPAAWYPHPTAPGWEAYWDGAAWGPETRPAQQAAPAVPPVQEQPVQQEQPAAVEPQPVAAQPAQQVAQEQPTAVQPEPAVAPQAAVAPVAAAPAAVAERGDSSLAPIFCILGAVVAIVGAFLPAATSDVFIDLADNTMVAAGYGIAVIAAAVLGAVIAAYCYVKSTRSWLPILLGVVVLGIAVYAGTAGLEITPENVPTGGAGKDLLSAAGVDDSGSPSTGIFAVGIGGLLMVLGGIGISREPK